LTWRPNFAGIALYSKESGSTSVPLAVDRIIHPWTFQRETDFGGKIGQGIRR